MVIQTIHPQPQSAILTRNRLQPDLVCDLPPPSQQDTTPPLSSTSSSMTSLDKQVEDVEEDTETLSDHFAKQNQSTLKKNEKFQHDPAPAPHCKKVEKPLEPSKTKNAIEDVVLRIEESIETSTDVNRLSTSSTSSQKVDVEKSPIPLRNTQRVVSQFADLKLTGGCSTTLKPITVPQGAATMPQQSERTEKDRASFTFASFNKPAISMKPQVLTKKKSIFLQAHSSASPSASPGPMDGSQ